MPTVPVTAGMVVYRSFTIRSRQTERTRKADALPTAVLYRDGSPIGAQVVTVQEQSGPDEYLTQVQLPPAVLVGSAWELLITAVVDGIEYQRWQWLGQTILPGGTVYRGFTTRAPTRVGVPADAPPSAIVLRNGAIEPVSVTINDVGSPNNGNYMLSFGVDPAWNVNDMLDILIFAQVEGEAVTRSAFLGRITGLLVNEVVVNKLQVLGEDDNIVLNDETITLAITEDEPGIIRLKDDERKVGVTDG